MITIRLYQQKSKIRADGTAAIYYVLGKNGKRKLISTDRYVSPKHFDNESGLVTRGADNSIKLNAYFKRQMTKLDDIIIDLSNEGTEATFDKIIERFTNDFSDDFIKFAEAELELQVGLIKEKTRKGYISSINNLKKWRPSISFNTINFQFLQQYKFYLVNDRKRKVNGYYQDFAAIKKLYKIAVAKGLAKGNPFKDFPLQKEDTNRNWLTKEELALLFDLVNDRFKNKVGENVTITEAVKNTLRHFLFCCFTGLRFGDKLGFDESCIVDDRIQIKTAKRGKYIIVPFNDQSRELLPYVLMRKLKQSKKRVGDDLEKCMTAVGITKDISFHCSRHTFAINCLLLGVDIITMRDWLGHRSVTTTEIYVKIAAQYKDASMKKMDGFFKLQT